jgi:large subunit ribosomal protein L15
VETLNAFPAGETVTPELLRATGFIRELQSAIKVLGDGELKIALTVRAHKFSKSAEEKITQAGGKVEILP